jgi:hypothetical protein
MILRGYSIIIATISHGAIDSPVFQTFEETNDRWCFLPGNLKAQK